VSPRVAACRVYYPEFVILIKAWQIRSQDDKIAAIVIEHVVADLSFAATLSDIYEFKSPNENTTNKKNCFIFNFLTATFHVSE
jgi:hypothetical protein